MDATVMSAPVYVYVIATVGLEDVACKVGVSRNPARRVKQLQSAVKRRLYLADVRLEVAETAGAVERYAHWLLRKHHIRGEWFAVDDPDAWRAVENAQAAIARGERAPFRIAGPGRPPLDMSSTQIRIPKTVRDRIADLVGSKGMASFIREAIEEKLAAAEAQLPRKSPPSELT
ncbi:GIY-YIG nuclease family protein [Methylobacterium brachiatum]|uniref:GIY-YIG nuclease family protein n=1 Tax=Methylobacterium brachiatum TaxID=269660 RepID=UPI0024482CBB|nr:GIY-YIG nuclease family protein [Methylobacterium brachiatum]MDH2311404.1 GIY-YIG nuclease family protein [Methylobacterium brachiatum]